MSEISAAAIKADVQRMTSFGPRPDGSEANLACVSLIADQLAVCGMQPMITTYPVDVFQEAEAFVELPDGRRLECTPNLRSGDTGLGSVLGPLVDVGKGRDIDFGVALPRGSIAICYQDHPFERFDGRPRYVHERSVAAFRAGAAALVLSTRRPDDLRTTFGLGRGIEPIPVVSVSWPDYQELAASSSKGAHIRVRVAGDWTRGRATQLSARLRGMGDGSRTILVVGSHHETVPGCPGANDNASGLAAMLEIARYFAARRLSHDLTFVATGGEESGHWVNAEWVKSNARWLRASACGAIVVSNLTGPAALWIRKWNGMETDGYWNGLLAEAAREVNYPLERREDVPFLSDATELLEIGVPAALILTPPDQLPYIHTPQDTADRVNVESVATIARLCAIALERHDKSGH